MRLNERREIMEKYETNKHQAYEDYPVSFALADILKYHQSCSFMVGLQKALEEGTQIAPGQDRASLEQKLKALVLEKDTRISELRRQKPGIKDEEINKDKYIIYLDGQIDAITKKLGEPETKKPAVPLTFSGKIESVDVGAKSIVVTSTDGKTKNTFVVDEQTTKISQDGNKLTFADLKKDMQVDVSYDKMEGNKATVTAIKVSPPAFSGKIESVDAGAKSIVVTSTDGKTEKTFVYDKDTTITKGTAKLQITDLKDNPSVDVEYKEEGGKVIATAIKVSTQKATPVKPAPPKAATTGK
jgi:translation elongation factor P/translation initiation factor 5A